MWVGKAVAQAMSLSPESDREVVKELLKRLYKLGALKTQPGKSSRREPTMFVVAT